MATVTRDGYLFAHEIIILWDIFLSQEKARRQSCTYPGGEADVVDKTENVGRAQVQHGQQGLEKKRLCFRLTFALVIDGTFNSDRVYLIAATSSAVETIYPLDCALVFAKSGSNHVSQQAESVILIVRENLHAVVPRYKDIKEKSNWKFIVKRKSYIY